MCKLMSPELQERCKVAGIVPAFTYAWCYLCAGGNKGCDEFEPFDTGLLKERMENRNASDYFLERAGARRFIPDVPAVYKILTEKLIDLGWPE